MKSYTKILEELDKNQYRWLITGVAGFIGSNILEKLLNLNQIVVGIDNFCTGHQSNLDDVTSKFEKSFIEDNFTFINGDIVDLQLCKKSSEGIDVILHQAALGSIPRSISDPISTHDANVNGFLNMLIAAKENKVGRFVYASSSAVYGDHPDLPKIEENIGRPLNPYAITKLINELYARNFSDLYEYRTIGLRYFNVFGFRQDPDGAYAAVIPKWIDSLIKGEQIYINGDGETSRDFCFIENAVQANLLAAMTNNDGALNQIYNVAVNQQTTLNQLYEIISNEINDAKIEKPIYRDFRKGDIRHSCADISKAGELLGYSPTDYVKDGLQKTIKWYIENEPKN